MRKKKSHWDIFPDELFAGLKIILPVTFGGIALFVGGWKSRASSGYKCTCRCLVKVSDANAQLFNGSLVTASSHTTK